MATYHKNRKEALQFVQHKSGHNGERPNVFLPDPTTRQEYSVAYVDIANIAYNNKYDA